MIAHDRQIAENTASDRQQLYGNTFLQSGDRAIVSDQAIVSNHQRLHGSTFQRSGDRWQSRAIQRLSDSSDPAIINDRMETRL